MLAKKKSTSKEDARAYYNQILGKHILQTNFERCLFRLLQASSSPIFFSQILQFRPFNGFRPDFLTRINFQGMFCISISTKFYSLKSNHIKLVMLAFYFSVFDFDFCLGIVCNIWFVSDYYNCGFGFFMKFFE